MESIVNGIPVQFVEHGSGTPVLGLHGVDVDHREMAGSLEPLFADRPGDRRIYPDLPGMGRTRRRQQHRRHPGHPARADRRDHR
jgi:pimeloyl-ACP methyl ester carboxylesterase